MSLDPETYPETCRRLAAECADDSRWVEASRPAIACVLAAAAAMAEQQEKLEASCNSAWAQVEVVTRERDNARWAEETRRKVYRAQIERLRDGIRRVIERHPATLDERKNGVAAELRKLIGDA